MFNTVSKFREHYDTINNLMKEYKIVEFAACMDTWNTKSVELVKRLGFEYTKMCKTRQFNYER
jgi:hypothetical protein